MGKPIELSIAKTYVQDWTYLDGIRELLQNTIDQETTTKTPCQITYNQKTETLTLLNPNSVLTADTLLLGTTTKTDQTSTIGQFGEGYKLALLVLTRENIPVTIENAQLKEIWKPRFVKSRKRFNKAEVLTIETTTQRIFDHTGVKFIIENITYEQYQEIQKRTLFLDNNYATLQQHVTPIGNILLEPTLSGNMYVNGLFVTHIDNVKYGYDVKPNYIDIGRDRNLINGFNSRDLRTHMWLALQDTHAPTIQELFESDYDDIILSEYDFIGYSKAADTENELESSNSNYEASNLSYSKTQKNKKLFAQTQYNKFNELHPNGFALTTPYNHENDKLSTIAKIITVDNGLYKAITELPEYQKMYKNLIEKLTNYKKTTTDRTLISIFNDYSELKKQIQYEIKPETQHLLDALVDELVSYQKPKPEDIATTYAVCPVDYFDPDSMHTKNLKVQSLHESYDDALFSLKDESHTYYMILSYQTKIHPLIPEPITILNMTHYTAPTTYGSEPILIDLTENEMNNYSQLQFDLPKQVNNDISLQSKTPYVSTITISNQEKNDLDDLPF